MSQGTRMISVRGRNRNLNSGPLRWQSSASYPDPQMYNNASEKWFLGSSRVVLMKGPLGSFLAI